MTTLRDLITATLHATEDGPTCDCAPAHREIYHAMADNVLALFDVQAEHRVNVTHPLVTGAWLPEPFDPVAAVDILPASWGGVCVERRWVLTTKAEAATTGATP
jgi:hypothetical protein